MISFVPERTIISTDVWGTPARAFASAPPANPTSRHLIILRQVQLRLDEQPVIFIKRIAIDELPGSLQLLSNQRIALRADVYRILRLFLPLITLVVNPKQVRRKAEDRAASTGCANQRLSPAPTRSASKKPRLQRPSRDEGAP